MAANWIQFQTFEKKDEEILAPWKLALDLFEGVNHVRLKATGNWTILPGLDVASDPDGVGGLPLAESALILAGAPAGCLLGRFGGSSAGATPTAGTGQDTTVNPVFMIGSECLVKLPDGVRGPLYVAFNVIARPVTIGELKLEISGISL